MTALRGRIPLLANLYWGQLAYGVALGTLGLSLVFHVTGAQALTPGAAIVRGAAFVVITLLFIAYLQNLHRFGLVPDYSLKCRFCNGPVNRYSEFCEHCGADLIADEKLAKCAKCGVDLYEGTAFCPECGAPQRLGKKAKKKKSKEPPSEPGWDTPVDAVTGFPPDDKR